MMTTSIFLYKFVQTLDTVGTKNVSTRSKSEGFVWDEPGDPLGFNVGPVDPANSRRRASQFDL